jgi:hypothetical protein
MNWRRGLFRLWIVGSALFVIAVAVISYREIKEQFDAAANAAAWEASEFETVVPQLCGEARGVAGEDYSTVVPNPSDKDKKPDPHETCWYKISKFRPLYPEYCTRPWPQRTTAAGSARSPTAHGACANST